MRGLLLVMIALLAPTFGSAGVIERRNLTPADENQLLWPICGVPPLIMSGYGDCRYDPLAKTVTFHKGVDIYAPADTSCYPVKGGLMVYDEAQFMDRSRGYDVLLVEVEGIRMYLYGHVGNAWPNMPDSLLDGSQLVDVNHPFCTIWDFDQNGSSDDDHLEFWVVDPTAGKPLNNPVWQDDSVEHLPFSSAASCSAMAVVYSYYFGPNDKENDSDTTTCNGYYPRSNLPGGKRIDAIVWAGSNPQGYQGPHGVCLLRMASAMETVGGQIPSQPAWQHVLDLRHKLPSDSDADKVLCVETAGRSAYGSSVIVPHLTCCSVDPNCLRTWYIITRFDSQGRIDTEGGFEEYPSTGDSIVYWIWLEATNHVGSTSMRTERVVFKMGPAELVSKFRADDKPLGILLTWEASPPEGIAGFRVSRKEAESDRFEPIDGSLTPASGSRGIPAFFSFLDSTALPGHDYWYRLDMLRTDQKWIETQWVTSATRSWGSGGTISLRVVPNPFRGFAEIRVGGWSAGGEPTILSVFDAAGQLVWSSQVEAGSDRVVMWPESGQERERVAPGVYFCKVMCGSATRSMTVVRMR